MCDGDMKDKPSVSRLILEKVSPVTECSCWWLRTKSLNISFQILENSSWFGKNFCLIAILLKNDLNKKIILIHWILAVHSRFVIWSFSFSFLVCVLKTILQIFQMLCDYNEDVFSIRRKKRLFVEKCYEKIKRKAIFVMGITKRLICS